MRRTLVHIGLFVGALTASGCADYVYRPATASTTVPVAAYRVSAPDPRGEVFLRSPGIIPLPAIANEQGKSLHVSMVVDNDAMQPWRVDTQQLTVVLPDGSERAPALAVSQNGAIVPSVEVPPGAERVVDLYYPLPPDAQRASRLKGFTARWQIETAEGTVKGETLFHRVNVGSVTTPCGAHASEYCLSGYAS